MCFFLAVSVLLNLKVLFQERTQLGVPCKRWSWSQIVRFFIFSFCQNFFREAKVGQKVLFVFSQNLLHLENFLCTPSFQKLSGLPVFFFTGTQSTLGDTFLRKKNFPSTWFFRGSTSEYGTFKVCDYFYILTCILGCNM